MVQAESLEQMDKWHFGSETFCLKILPDLPKYSGTFFFLNSICSSLCLRFFFFFPRTMPHSSLRAACYLNLTPPKFAAFIQHLIVSMAQRAS